MARAGLISAGLAALALGAGAVWWFVLQPAARPARVLTTEGAFMALSARALPDPLLRAAPLPDTDLPALVESIAQFPVVSRASQDGPFEPARERRVLDSRKADLDKALALPDVQAWGRSDSDTMAMYNADADGIPAAVFCDVAVAEEGASDWFCQMTQAHSFSAEVNAWAASVFTTGQLPRPGLWVANMALIRESEGSQADWQQLVDTLGNAPRHLTLSRNAFRAELPS